MKLRTIRIENFRSFRDETIHLDDYTCLVGPNGCGKSTVLLALNVFFRNSTASSANLLELTKEDFHRGVTNQPIRITLTFNDLSDEAKDDFSAYVRHDQLVVSAVAEWSEQQQAAPVQQFGSRLVHPAFKPYFAKDKDGVPVAELKSVYSELRARFPSLPDAKTKASMVEALKDYESAHEDECELSESSDQFYGYTKGENRFARHLQFVYVPAVKDAVSEQDEARTSALGQLLARTIRTRVNFKERLDDFRRTTRESYDNLFSTEDAVLGDLSESLQRRLRDWTTEESRLDLKWHYDDGMFDKISEPFARLRAGDSRFLGELVRLGHGMQRTIIVSLLQELAESSNEGPRLLLCIEEPELYQHPPQARHLADVLESLSQAKTQCLVTTHSPIFVSSRGFEAVRSVGINPDGQTRVRQLRLADLAARLGAAKEKDPVPASTIEAHLLQVLEPNQAEMFFCSAPVLVEGAEDAALIIAQLHLSKMWAKFRKLGGLVVTSTGKSKLPDLLAICQGLELPTFTVFDADGDGSQDKSDRDCNRCLFKLLGHDDSVPFPAETLWGENFVVWRTSLTGVVRDESGGDGKWGQALQKVRDEHGLSESVTKKNKVLLGLTLNRLSETGVPIQSLEKLVSQMIAHAEAHASRVVRRSA